MPVDPLHGSLETYVPPDETDPTESIDAVDAAGTDAIPTSTPSLSGPQAVRESEQLQESVEALLEELHDMSVGDIQLDGELTEMEEEVSILCSHYIQKAGLAALRINALRNIMRDNNLTGDVDIEEFARSLKAEDLPGLSRGVLGPEDLIFLQDATLGSSYLAENADVDTGKAADPEQAGDEIPQNAHVLDGEPKTIEATESDEAAASEEGVDLMV